MEVVVDVRKVVGHVPQVQPLRVVGVYSVIDCSAVLLCETLKLSNGVSHLWSKQRNN